MFAGGDPETIHALPTSLPPPPITSPESVYLTDGDPETLANLVDNLHRNHITVVQAEAMDRAVPGPGSCEAVVEGGCEARSGRGCEAGPGRGGCEAVAGGGCEAESGRGCEAVAGRGWKAEPGRGPGRGGCGPVVTVCPFWWDDSIPQQLQLYPADVLLGADILYDPCKPLTDCKHWRTPAVLFVAVHFVRFEPKYTMSAHFICV